MDLKLRPKEECMFDEISLGEIMLRLDPGEGRIKTAHSELGKAAANIMLQEACAAALE